MALFFEETLRAIHGDAKVDAYIAKLDAERAAREPAEREADLRAQRAWNDARDMAVAAGDWFTVARMDK